jgi:hypothetical protein
MGAARTQAENATGMHLLNTNLLKQFWNIMERNGKQYSIFKMAI